MRSTTNLSNRTINKLSAYTIRFKEAWTAIGNGRPDHAISLRVMLLEAVLRDLISENIDKFNVQLKKEILYREKEAKQKGLNFLITLYSNLKLFDAIEDVTKKPTHSLKTNSLHFNDYRINIRNLTSHDLHFFTADKAIFLLNTLEPFLAYRGFDVFAARYGEGTHPVRFSNSEQCLQLLLSKIWEFPESGGTRSSWAVKESSVLKGNYLKRPNDQD